MVRISPARFQAFLLAIICCSGFSFLMPLRIYLICLFLGFTIFQNLEGSNMHLARQPLMYALLEQLEVILVNDGSTDKSPDKCQEYAKKYSNIVVINKDNGGVSSARNAGISAAHGQYIAFVDGDDYVATDFFQEMLDAIVYSQSDLVIFDYYVVYNGDSKKAYRGEIQENYFTSDGAMREFLKGGAIGINLFDKAGLTDDRGNASIQILIYIIDRYNNRYFTHNNETHCRDCW